MFDMVFTPVSFIASYLLM